jgi:hypothetical protein
VDSKGDKLVHSGIAIAVSALAFAIHYDIASSVKPVIDGDSVLFLLAMSGCISLVAAIFPICNLDRDLLRFTTESYRIRRAVRILEKKIGDDNNGLVGGLREIAAWKNRTRNQAELEVLKRREKVIEEEKSLFENKQRSASRDRLRQRILTPALPSENLTNHLSAELNKAKAWHEIVKDAKAAGKLYDNPELNVIREKYLKWSKYLFEILGAILKDSINIYWFKTQRDTTAILLYPKNFPIQEFEQDVQSLEWILSVGIKPLDMKNPKEDLTWLKEYISEP